MWSSWSGQKRLEGEGPCEDLGFDMGGMVRGEGERTFVPVQVASNGSKLQALHANLRFACAALCTVREVLFQSYATDSPAISRTQAI